MYEKPDAWTVKPDCILIRYGEIALKGRATRNQFENQLKRNIKKALKSVHIEFTIKMVQGRVLIETDNLDSALTHLSHVFGITSISPIYQVPTDLSRINERVLALVKKNTKKHPRFALRVHRVGTHAFTSQDVAIKVGSYVQEHTKFPVDLTHPDIEVFIEIRDDQTLIYQEKIPGPGGMPVGTQGRVLSIIDSPYDLLASWFLLKRGCAMVFVYTKEQVMTDADSFFHKWHISKYARFVEPDDDYWNHVSNIITEQRCQALCSGTLLSSTDTAGIKIIRHIKKQVSIPVLTPLISFHEGMIKTLCEGKGIFP